MRITFVVATVAATLAIAGCAGASSGGAEVAATGAETAEDGIQELSCKDVIPEVLALTEDEPTGGSIVAIYRPEVVSDKIEEFNAEQLPIPAGKNQVEVLTCSGEATFDDGTEDVPITFGVQVDTNDEIFIRYNVV